MGRALELTPEKAKDRLTQAKEMEEIWEASESPIQMYLIGCIVTAKALHDSKIPNGD